MTSYHIPVGTKVRRFKIVEGEKPVRYTFNELLSTKAVTFTEADRIPGVNEGDYYFKLPDVAAPYIKVSIHKRNVQVNP